MSFPKKMPLNVVSAYRAPLYGAAIIWVMLFHAAAIFHCSYAFGHEELVWLHSLMRRGKVGVDIFLFLSGICLYFSYTKNPDTHDFLKKRFLRLITPVVLIDGIYWFVLVFFIKGGTIWSFLSRILLVRFWVTGDSSIWFVSWIAVLYLLYPIIYAILFKKGTDASVIVRGVVLCALTCIFLMCLYREGAGLYDRYSIALTRLPVFILGCVFGKFVYEKHEVSWGWFAVIVAMCAAFYFVNYFKLIGGIKYDMSHLIGGIGFAYLFSVIFWGIDSLCKRWKSWIIRFFSVAGGASLELYLAHIMIGQVFRMTPYYVKGDLSDYLLFVCVPAFALALVMAKLVGAINKKILQGFSSKKLSSKEA